ncbi:MCE family protein [Nocardioides sp. HDW12B]|uniref:MCE family protein n=1 Tax=Nocardioides sp. HDW12B TaxID=2714939 RepID=UPI00140A7446|nr:MCE family protein [Nocardioides sp. HDW12B]QIK66709.1 MCE family protein [Nocardioides sp. HDW12B]
MSVNRRTLIDGSKLAFFTVISLIVTGTLVAIMGKLGTGPTETYSAVFSDASLIQKGDDVRVAGVVLGKVQGVEIVDTDRAQVEFSVAEDLPLTEATQVEIRYLNLVGDRYLAVEEGDPDGAGEVAELEPGATIPMSRTTPALNLTALYNGFAPLFSALDPAEVNDLSLNLVKVLQGEGGTVESLMQETASLTTAIANRDELVGQTISNLDELLGTVDSRHRELTQLISELRRWVGGLAEDRVQIGRSVVNIGNLTQVLADLLRDGRPLIKRDIAQLRRLAAVLSRDDTRAVLNTILTNLPEMLADQTRTGTYGSWYNYFVCGANADIQLPAPLVQELPGLRDLANQLRTIKLKSDAERCYR